MGAYQLIAPPGIVSIFLRSRSRLLFLGISTDTPNAAADGDQQPDNCDPTGKDDQWNDQHGQPYRCRPKEFSDLIPEGTVLIAARDDTKKLWLPMLSAKPSYRKP